MSIKFISNLVFDIYVKKELLNDINIDNKIELEKYLKNLFIVLNEKYNITMEGFYDVVVYVDKKYGLVFHFKKEELDYYDYFKSSLDLRISIINKDFYYIVEDIPKELIDKVNVNTINEKICIKLKEELSNKDMMILTENSEIKFN